MADAPPPLLRACSRHHPRSLLRLGTCATAVLAVAAMATVAVLSAASLYVLHYRPLLASAPRASAMAAWAHELVDSLPVDLRVVVWPNGSVALPHASLPTLVSASAGGWTGAAVFERPDVPVDELAAKYGVGNAGAHVDAILAGPAMLLLDRAWWTPEQNATFHSAALVPLRYTLVNLSAEPGLEVPLAAACEAATPEELAGALAREEAAKQAFAQRALAQGGATTAVVASAGGGATRQVALTPALVAAYRALLAQKFPRWYNATEITAHAAAAAGGLDVASHRLLHWWRRVLAATAAARRAAADDGSGPLRLSVVGGGGGGGGRFGGWLNAALAAAEAADGAGGDAAGAAAAATGGGEHGADTGAGARRRQRARQQRERERRAVQPAAAPAAAGGVTPARALGDPRAVTPAAGPLVAVLNAITDALTDGRGQYHHDDGGAPATFTSAYVCTRATLSAGVDALFDTGNAAYSALTNGWGVTAALLGVAWGVAFVQVLAWLPLRSVAVGCAVYILLMAAWRGGHTRSRQEPAVAHLVRLALWTGVPLAVWMHVVAPLWLPAMLPSGASAASASGGSGGTATAPAAGSPLSSPAALLSFLRLSSLWLQYGAHLLATLLVAAYAYDVPDPPADEVPAAAAPGAPAPAAPAAATQPPTAPLLTQEQLAAAAAAALILQRRELESSAALRRADKRRSLSHRRRSSQESSETSGGGGSSSEDDKNDNVQYPHSGSFDATNYDDHHRHVHASGDAGLRHRHRKHRAHTAGSSPPGDAGTHTAAARARREELARQIAQLQQAVAAQQAELQSRLAAYAAAQQAHAAAYQQQLHAAAAAAAAWQQQPPPQQQMPAATPVPPQQ